MQASGDQRKALWEQLEKRLASMRSAFAARWIRRAAPRAEPRVKPKVLYGLLVLRGFERLGDRDDAAAVVQEWWCGLSADERRAVMFGRRRTPRGLYRAVTRPSARPECSSPLLGQFRVCTDEHPEEYQRPYGYGN